MNTKTIIFLFFLFVVIAAAAGYVAWHNKKSTNTSLTPAPTQPDLPSVGRLWSDVAPGFEISKVTQKLGAPKKSEISAGNGTLTYRGANQYWDTALSVQNDKVIFIREHVFLPQNVSLKTRLAELSDQPTKLYGKISESGQFVYVSPKDGVAFLANDQNNTVYEVWYFVPGSLENVLLLPAFKNLSLNPNTVVGGR